MSRSGGRVFDGLYGRVPWCRRDVLNALLDLAIEIAREGREGRRIGTLFTLGHADAVLAHSRPLIMDPLAGHAPLGTSVSDASVRGTVKELAQLDGAFVIADDGTFRAACRYLNASVEDIDVPFGLGSRHLVAASISQRLGVIAIVVSESAIVRVFHGGELIAEIIPEVWLFRRHLQSHLRGRGGRARLARSQRRGPPGTAYVAKPYADEFRALPARAAFVETIEDRVITMTQRSGDSSRR